MATNFAPTIIYNDVKFKVSDLLYRAARMGRVLKHPGQGLSSSETKEFFDVLNFMLDGMKIENMLIFQTRRVPQVVQPGQFSYSVGPGQDFDMERPEHIHRASFVVTPGTGEAEVPMQIILTFEEWQLIATKQTSSNVPLALYYQATVPFGQASFWPVPNIQSAIVLYVPQLLSQFLTADDDLVMPYGYLEMLCYNLAVALHEHYPEKPLAQTVESKAAFYKQRVKSNQAKPLFIPSDDAAMQPRSGPWYGGFPKLWNPYGGGG